MISHRFVVAEVACCCRRKRTVDDSTPVSTTTFVVRQWLLASSAVDFSGAAAFENAPPVTRREGAQFSGGSAWTSTQENNSCWSHRKSSFQPPEDPRSEGFQLLLPASLGRRSGTAPSRLHEEKRRTNHLSSRRTDVLKTVTSRSPETSPASTPAEDASATPSFLRFDDDTQRKKRRRGVGNFFLFFLHARGKTRNANHGKKRNFRKLESRCLVTCVALPVQKEGFNMLFAGR